MLCLVVALVGRPASAAEDPTKGDVRDIQVGVLAHELPVEGYVKRRCAAGGRVLDSWTAYSSCAPDAGGLREVAFEFDDAKAEWAAVNDKWEGTKISGHPVNLSILVDDAGLVTALHINTDPSARAYMRKKAFLLRLRILGRYGRDGWDCKRKAMGDGYAKVGGLYIDETCTKRYANRALTMTTRVYRTPEQTQSEFTNSTRLEIRWLGGS